MIFLFFNHEIKQQKKKQEEERRFTQLVQITRANYTWNGMDTSIRMLHSKQNGLWTFYIQFNFVRWIDGPVQNELLLVPFI